MAGNQAGIAIKQIKRFKCKSAQSAEYYLKIAQQAEKYIAQNMHDSDAGSYWSDPSDGRTDLSFYSGCAGIVYFYVKLNQACPEKRYETYIARGTAYLLANLEQFFAGQAVYEDTLPKMTKKGLYFGLGGIGLVFLEVYRNFRDANAELGAKRITNYYTSKLKTGRSGIHWTVSPALAMDGGILLYLLDFCRTFPDEHLKEILLSAGRRYLRSGSVKKTGTIEYNGYGGFLPYGTPNWEFGNGGAGYVLTELYRFTGNEQYLQAAVNTAKYILEVKVPQKAGYLIPHHVSRFQREPTLFYAGLCHGPVGTSRLFYRLYQLTGDNFWYSQIIQLTEGLASIGAPEIYTPGLWNNVSYCCGQGGLLHFFLSLYHADHSTHWHDLAVRSANVLLGEMDEMDGQTAKWHIAWQRTKPDHLTAPIGFYDGAAGIAASLLELYLTETGRFVWQRLIDDPFPENNGENVEIPK